MIKVVIVKVNYPWALINTAILLSSKALRMLLHDLLITTSHVIVFFPFQQTYIGPDIVVGADTMHNLIEKYTRLETIPFFSIYHL